MTYDEWKAREPEHFEERLEESPDEPTSAEAEFFQKGVEEGLERAAHAVHADATERETICARSKGCTHKEACAYAVRALYGAAKGIRALKALKAKP